jgi:hypothetical protein
MPKVFRLAAGEDRLVFDRTREGSLKSPDLIVKRKTGSFSSGLIS